MNEQPITPSPWIIGAIKSNNAEITEDALAIWPANVTESAKEFSQPVCLITPLSQLNDTDLGNAQLIAMAPDLLKALRELAYAYQSHVFDGQDDEEYSNAINVIVKATQINHDHNQSRI